MSDDALLDAIRAIWERSRDAIMERVVVLQHAANAALAGDLTPEDRRNAERQVHKLAGAIGTFGFWDASTLSKEAEALLQGDAPLSRIHALRLRTIATQVDEQLARGPSGPSIDESAPPETDSVDQPPPEATTHDSVQSHRPTPTARSAMPSDERIVSFARRAHPRLLVIGNDIEFRDRMITEARSLGIDILSACSAAEARTMLADPVDAVILDLTLPEVGFSFLEEIHGARPVLPVIVISDTDEFHDRVEAARLGGRGFLQKPVRPSQLIDLLRDSLVSAPNDVATIVAVDDDPELLALIQALLQPIGARVVTVTDSLRVLNVLVEHAPDLVMLDVDMPGLNGIELCRVLRNDPRWAAVPILFLTARAESANVTQMFEAGADDFVSKPVMGPELVARVRNRLERTRMLRLAADVDSLTGVATRRRGIEVLERYFRLAQRQRQPISIAAIDLDHFKQVNDRYGHLIGDMVLRRVAGLLAGFFRGEDIVARWGGEEFVIGMYAMPADAAVRRLQTALAKLHTEEFEAGNSKLKVTFSAGVGEFPVDGDEWTTLYRVADTALSEAKSTGRNRVLRAGVAPG
ncbi:MAG TPA: response regulator [Gemmatimonadaceae bacterium]